MKKWTIVSCVVGAVIIGTATWFISSAVTTNKVLAEADERAGVAASNAFIRGVELGACEVNGRACNLDFTVQAGEQRIEFRVVDHVVIHNETAMSALPTDCTGYQRLTGAYGTPSNYCSVSIDVPQPDQPVP